MIYHAVHMRDQKANQQAMVAKTDRQALANMVEEVTVVIVLWGVFILAGLN
jgi:hypothetical protein